MLSPRRFLSRRWLLAFLGSAALLFGLAMLHPYPRQSLFGPTIRGKPWCVWENAVRRGVFRENYQEPTWVKMMRWMGVKHEKIEGDELFNHVEMFPLLLALAEDSDVEVRRDVLSAFLWCDQFLDDPAILPVLRRRLDDADPQCRISAARGIYGIDPKEPVQAILLRELYGSDYLGCIFAIDGLNAMGQTNPELLPHLVKFAANEGEDVRTRVIQGLSMFGVAALPHLCQGLDDRESSVRLAAARSLKTMNVFA
jgi:hypothetical protein